MKRFALAVCGLAFMLPANARAAMTTHTINVAGVTRTYGIVLPQSYSSRKAYPIVITLHGGNGDGARIDYQTGMSAATRTRGAVAVFPNALRSAAGSQWNDGRAETNSSGEDDVAFLSALAGASVAQWGHDPARVYLAGSSSGGMMTIRMMCERTAKFAAYGVVIADLPVDEKPRCSPQAKSPVVFFHSTTDPVMPFAGGVISGGNGLGASGTVVSSTDTVTLFAQNLGCGSQPAPTRLPVLVNDGTQIDMVSWDTCRLDWYQVVGGGHAWPGGTTDAKFGVTTQNLKATPTILKFFGL